MSLLLPTQECKTILALTLTSREASFTLPLARGVGSTTTAAEMGGTKVNAIHHPTSMELRRKKKGLRLVRSIIESQMYVAATCILWTESNLNGVVKQIC